MVRSDSTEVGISTFLTNEPGLQNHTIRVLEVIPMYDQPEWSFLVMPRMRRSSDVPLFDTVREFTEFVQQVLEGLEFLHSKNIAHRDICTANLVVDPSRMIPGGFHFVCPYLASDGVHFLYTIHDMKSRTMAGPLQYYYIDFGLSVRFPSFETRELVTGEYGRLRKHVPEISESVPYDPFKADVRLVGEMIRTEFLLEYTGLDFIIPLVTKLRRHDPARRPDAAEALGLFRRLISKLNETELAKSTTCVMPSNWRGNC
ncbi:kinase-like domain-containing protein [Mycena capillaripes]|nr:kinase-like domain-containing protein [Mycena capillaripes]